MLLVDTHPILISNQLTVPVKIDGRQQQEETSALSIEAYNTHAGQAWDYKCSIFKENLQSWVARCLMDIFILVVISNQ